MLRRKEKTASSETDTFRLQGRADSLVKWLTIAIMLIYAAPVFLSVPFTWGVHQLKYMPLGVQLAFTAILALTLVPSIPRIVGPLIEMVISRISAMNHVMRFLLLVLISGLASWILWNFKIAIDVYGDAPTIGRYQSVYVLSNWRSAFSFLEIEAMTRTIHAAVAELLKIDLLTSYRVVSVVCGGLFVFTALMFVISSKQNLTTRIFISSLLLFNGANQLFFGHVENYTILYLLSSLYLFSAIRYFEEQRSFWIALVVLIIAIKVHLAAIVFIPSLLYLVGHKLGEKFPSLKRFVSAKNITFAVLASAIVGIALYLWVLHAFHADYSKTQEIRRETLLLPVTAPTSMISSHYTLFSPYHLVDFMNLIFYITSGGVIIALVLAAFLFRKIRWKKPIMIFTGLAALYSLVFAFMLNSAIGTPFDWDLLSIASLPLVFLAGLALGDIFTKPMESIKETSSISILVVSLASSVIIGVLNASPSSLLQRLEDVTVWSHESYFYRSTYPMNAAIKTIGDPRTQIEAFKKLLDRLLPDSPPRDREAFLIAYNIGALHENLREREQAVNYYELALRLSPDEPLALKGLGVTYYVLKKYDKSLETLEKYIKHFKNDAEVYKIAGVLHHQLNLSKPKAIEYLTRFLELQKNDPDAERVKTLLEELKKLQST